MKNKKIPLISILIITILLQVNIINAAPKSRKPLIYAAKAIPAAAKTKVSLFNLIMHISLLRSKRKLESPIMQQQLLNDIATITNQPKIKSLAPGKLFHISFMPSLASLGGTTTGTSSLSIIAPKLALLTITSTTTTTTTTNSTGGVTTTTTTSTSTTMLTSLHLHLNFTGSTTTTTTSAGGTTTTTTTSSAHGLGLTCSTSTSSSASGGAVTATATLTGGFPLPLPGLPFCLF